MVVGARISVRYYATINHFASVIPLAHARGVCQRGYRSQGRRVNLLSGLAADMVCVSQYPAGYRYRTPHFEKPGNYRKWPKWAIFVTVESYGFTAEPCEFFSMN